MKHLIAIHFNESDASWRNSAATFASDVIHLKLGPFFKLGPFKVIKPFCLSRKHCLVLFYLNVIGISFKYQTDVHKWKFNTSVNFVINKVP